MPEIIVASIWEGRDIYTFCPAGTTLKEAKAVYIPKGATSARVISVEEYLAATEPPVSAEELEKSRAGKLAEVLAGYDAAFAPIEAAYPAKERETWTIQLEEARALMADPAAETPMLSILVATRGRGESALDFAEAVMANNASYRQLAGYLTGQQQRMFAEVKALKSVEDIEAYKVFYRLPEGIGYAGT